MSNLRLFQGVRGSLSNKDNSGACQEKLHILKTFCIGLDLKKVQALIMFALQKQISKSGLMEASKNIFKLIGMIILLFGLSLICALLFWYIRASIPGFLNHSYKAYAIFLDSFGSGIVPSFWAQKYFRNEFLDNFLRWVWYSYVYVLLFGGAFVFLIKGDTKRYFLATILTLVIGLLIHYILPTQPPWMAIGEVIRINGNKFIEIDKNLTAAMPSIHQAIICVFTCSLWKNKIYGKIFSIIYNLTMAAALVYLGEHFVIDAVAAVFLAIGSWFWAEKILSRMKTKLSIHPIS